MKKLIILGLAFMMIGVAASAQSRKADRFRMFKIHQGVRQGDLNRIETRKLYRDEFRYRIARKNAARDGYISPFERRRLMHMKKNERREYVRFRHNRFRRVI